VTGYDEQYADLIHYQSGNAQYLAEGARVVTTQQFYTTTTSA
jgi:hypothetical protein